MVLWTIIIILTALWWMGLMTGYTMGLFIHVLIAAAIILLVISINREVSIYQELKKKLQETSHNRKYKNKFGRNRAVTRNTFPDKIALIKTIWQVLIPIIFLSGLVLIIAAANLIADASPKAIEIKRAQELAIIFKQGERDRAEFERLRRKHGLAATAVVIYEPGETPYYYGSGNEKVALK